MKKYTFLSTCPMCKFSDTCKYKIDMENLAKSLSDTFELNYNHVEDLPINMFSLLCDCWQSIYDITRKE